MNLKPSQYVVHPSVQKARRLGKPIVALESTVITHGLPQPENLSLARDMEAEITQKGAVPATIAVLQGRIHIGLDPEELESLAADSSARKISVRDFAAALTLNENGGTTVAATMFAAHAAGIQVFATGGIGGVHREPAFDVSADLPQLARTPLLIVCAGAKAILDLPATLEYLETHGVPVIGYGTDEFPSFFAAGSGLPVSVRLDSAGEVVNFARNHWELGFHSAVLVAQPPPPDSALDREILEDAIEKALADARAEGVRGQAVTPFLLTRVSELTHTASLESNLALLKNNARLAADISAELNAGNKKSFGFV